VQATHKSVLWQRTVEVQEGMIERSAAHRDWAVSARRVVDQAVDQARKVMRSLEEDLKQSDHRWVRPLREVVREGVVAVHKGCEADTLDAAASCALGAGHMHDVEELVVGGSQIQRHEKP
jgi:exoribonuclease II